MDLLWHSTEHIKMLLSVLLVSLVTVQGYKGPCRKVPTRWPSTDSGCPVYTLQDCPDLLKIDRLDCCFQELVPAVGGFCTFWECPAPVPCEDAKKGLPAAEAATSDTEVILEALLAVIISALIVTCGFIFRGKLRTHYPDCDFRRLALRLLGRREEDAVLLLNSSFPPSSSAPEQQLAGEDAQDLPDPPSPPPSTSSSNQRPARTETEKVEDLRKKLDQDRKSYEKIVRDKESKIASQKEEIKALSIKIHKEQDGRANAWGDLRDAGKELGELRQKLAQNVLDVTAFEMMRRDFSDAKARVQYLEDERLKLDKDREAEIKTMVGALSDANAEVQRMRKKNEQPSGNEELERHIQVLLSEAEEQVQRLATEQLDLVAQVKGGDDQLKFLRSELSNANEEVQRLLREASNKVVLDGAGDDQRRQALKDLHDIEMKNTMERKKILRDLKSAEDSAAGFKEERDSLQKQVAEQAAARDEERRNDAKCKEDFHIELQKSFAEQDKLRVQVQMEQTQREAAEEENRNMVDQYRAELREMAKEVNENTLVEEKEPSDNGSEQDSTGGTELTAPEESSEDEGGAEDKEEPQGAPGGTTRKSGRPTKKPLRYC